MKKGLVTFSALVLGVQARWQEPQDWEDAVQHRQDVRYFPQDAEAGYYQPYAGLEYPEFVASAVPAHMYQINAPSPQNPPQQTAIAPPPNYQKQYSVYPYQPPHLHTENLASWMLTAPRP